MAHVSSEAGGIIEEVQKGINPKAGAEEVVKVEQKEEDILDSWEDGLFVGMFRHDVTSTYTWILANHFMGIGEKRAGDTPDELKGVAVGQMT